MTPQTKKSVPRLNLKLDAKTNEMLREIAKETGLKLVTIIAKGIRGEYSELRNKTDK